jgi:hypothetical protein
MATRAYLVQEIMKELGVWQSGQDLSPEDYRAIDESLPFKLASMAKAHIYTVDDLDTDVPDEAAPELAVYLAGEYAQSFGLSGEELATVKQNAGMAEGALRFHRTRGPTYTRMRIERF